jgi:hypothetical protein
MRSEEVDMRAHISVRCSALTLLTVGLACSSTTARVDNTRTAAAQDTAATQNPPGYRGMERDTTTVPAAPETPVDTLLQRQGTGATHDTTDYLHIERDTTLEQSGRSVDSTVAAPVDTMARDTAGYGRPQQYDSTSR